MTVGVVNFFRDEKIGAKGVTAHKVGGRAEWPEHTPVTRESPYHKIKRVLVEEEAAEDVERSSSRPIKSRSVGKRDRMHTIKLTISMPMTVTLVASVNYSKILLSPQELPRACRI